MWGELACHERLFNPPPQFSRLGTGVQTFLYKCFGVSCMYLDGGMGGRRVATYFFAFFSIIYILELVCYKHTIHIIKERKNIFKMDKEVRMLLQKRANTTGVGISNFMRISIYLLTTTPTKHTYTFLTTPIDSTH